MVEHGPWVGGEYQLEGLNGQRIAIVGYSHWYEEGGKDDADVTTDVVAKVVRGEDSYEKIRFFVEIRDYFGYGCHQDFWPRVLFFNYLSECIGTGPDRYRVK